MISRKLYLTDIESIMQTALVARGIFFVSQYPIHRKYGYVADFYLPEDKIIIECDGEAWHKVGNSHDQKRDAVLNKKGFKIFRFRGNEIKEDVNSCIQKVVSMKGGIKNAI